jgi:hypothetical protein
MISVKANLLRIKALDRSTSDTGTVTSSSFQRIDYAFLPVRYQPVRQSARRRSKLAPTRASFDDANSIWIKTSFGSCTPRKIRSDLADRLAPGTSLSNIGYHVSYLYPLGAAYLSAGWCHPGCATRFPPGRAAGRCPAHFQLGHGTLRQPHGHGGRWAAQFHRQPKRPLEPPPPRLQP